MACQLTPHTSRNSAVLTVDGQYGLLTTQAVRNVQAAEGASVDGIYGPQTILDGFEYKTTNGFCEKAPGAK